MTVRARTGRSDSTRAVILQTAERLFAEQGIPAVSNRQVSEAAGQGNNAAVSYHIGTKTDLVRAVAARHLPAVERRRAEMVAAARGSTDIAVWAACLVRPVTEHLAALGSPTWFARFGAQIITDPTLRSLLADEVRQSPALQAVIVGLKASLDLPAPVREQRADMVRLLMAHVPAERERELAEGRAVPGWTWYDLGTELVRAVTSIMSAPAD